MPDPSAPGLAARITVWLGGAAFVGSLVITLVAFFVGMRAAPPGSYAAAAALVDVLLFSVFALHHSLLARSTARRWLTARIPAYLERSLFVWVASALLIAVVVAWEPLPGHAYRHQGWAAVPHWAIVLAGLWLIARATRVIDPRSCRIPASCSGSMTRVARAISHSPASTIAQCGTAAHPWCR